MKNSKDSGRSWFHVYLDNFCAGEVVAEITESKDVNKLHAALEESWSKAGVVSSTKKRVANVDAVQELGALVSGKSRMIGASGERLVKLIQSTLFIISRPWLKRKWVQVVAGRWIHILQFRRPGMVLLDTDWSFISKTTSGKAVEDQVRKELWNCC